MNKIVRNYPVDSLPLDLREGLPEHGQVEIEIRLKEVSKSLRKPLAAYIGSLPNLYGPDEDVVAYLREGREDR